MILVGITRESVPIRVVMDNEYNSVTALTTVKVIAEDNGNKYLATMVRVAILTIGLDGQTQELLKWPTVENVKIIKCDKMRVV
jgi:hypothetical protein